MRVSPSIVRPRLARRVLVALCVSIVATGISPAGTWATPANPTGVVAESKAGTASATISWVAPTGATRFRARAYIGNVAVKMSTILSATTTRHTFVGLEYRIPYTLKVQAGDGSTWGTEVGSTPASVVPEAAPPSAPDKPTVSVVADKKITAKWAAPASTGGSPIDSYQVQLHRKGDAIGDPVTVKGVSYDFTTEDATGSYSVTVKAVNAMALVSPVSEESDSIVPELKAAVAVTVPRSGSGGGSGGGSNGGAGNSGGGSNNTGSGNSGGGNSGGSGTTGGGNVAVPLAVTPVPALQATTPATTTSSARYTKSVKINTRTTKRTVLALSRLKTSKSSKVTYTISSTSRKICSMSSTSIKALRAGTCSVKVTVKTGRTTSSRTVKLLVTRASKANVLRR